MQFYNTSSPENSLVHECWDLCDADVDSYSLAAVTRRFNTSLEELIAEIINADGTFEYDDTNHTDLPVGTGNLVDSQQSYSFSSEYLQIRQIEVKDASGDWHVLKQIDYRDFTDVAIEEYFPSTGMPTHYDILGDTIRLYPAPATASVTLTAGLKVKFTRTVDLFTTSDTTQEPGLPSPYHKLLPYMAALPYCASYKKDRVSWLKTEIGSADPQSPYYGGMRLSLIKFYTRRNKDQRNVITMKPPAPFK